METESGFLRRKVDIAQQVLSIENPELLEAVYAVILNSNIPTDWYERLGKEEKEGIRQSREEFAAGVVVSHEDLMPSHNQAPE